MQQCAQQIAIVHEGKYKYMCLGKLDRQVKLLTEYSSMMNKPVQR